MLVTRGPPPTDARLGLLPSMLVTRAAPPAEADDRARHQRHRLKLTTGSACCRRCSSPGGRSVKLTPVFGLVEGPGPEVDARPAVLVTRGHRLKLTIGSARSRGRGLKLTPVLVTTGAAPPPVLVTRAADTHVDARHQGPPPEADDRVRPGRGPGPEADDHVRHQGRRLTIGPPADFHVDARHQGPRRRLTIGSARSRVRGVKLTPVLVTGAAADTHVDARHQEGRAFRSALGKRLKPWGRIRQFLLKFLL